MKCLWCKEEIKGNGIRFETNELIDPVICLSPCAGEILLKVIKFMRSVE